MGLKWGLFSDELLNLHCSINIYIYLHSLSIFSQFSDSASWVWVCMIANESNEEAIEPLTP